MFNAKCLMVNVYICNSTFKIKHSTFIMRLYLFLLVLFISFQVHLQSNLNWGIEVKSKGGFIAAKRIEVAQIPVSHALAGEVSFVIHTNGKKAWHKAYNYPTIGVTGFVASVGNREVLGNYFGSYGFVEFPFIKTKRYQFTGKIGSGLAYTAKVYDPIKNPKNSVVGAHVNALICFGLQNRFVFNRHQIVLGIDLTHCSNGSYKVPNIGINMPYLSLGYAYRMKTTELETENKVTLPFRKVLYGVTGVFSADDIYPTGHKPSAVYALSAFARYFFKAKVGAELSLDFVSKQVLMRYKPELPKTQLDIIQVGMYAGYILPLDHFHFVVGMGIYLRDKYVPNSLFYHRIGMRYYFNNGIHLNCVLLSNWAKANYTEWGIGYTFNYKK